MGNCGNEVVHLAAAWDLFFSIIMSSTTEVLWEGFVFLFLFCSLFFLAGVSFCLFGRKERWKCVR